MIGTTLAILCLPCASHRSIHSFDSTHGTLRMSMRSRLQVRTNIWTNGAWTPDSDASNEASACTRMANRRAQNRSASRSTALVLQTSQRQAKTRGGCFRAAFRASRISLTSAKQFLENRLEHQTTFFSTSQLPLDQLLIRNRVRNNVALIVSGTSWTPDEDFGILLEAIESIESSKHNAQLEFVFVVTGNGPQRKHYEQQLAQMNLKRCAVLTMWLSIQDYPVFLACADLGISLHYSSSGFRSLLAFHSH